jgi:hypothetical protein
MFVGMQLGGVLVVLAGVQVMTMRDFRMMRGLLMSARFVMLGGFAMMLGGMLMVMRRALMMLVDVVLVKVLTVHRSLPGLVDAGREHCRHSMKHLRPAFVSSRRLAAPRR